MTTREESSTNPPGSFAEAFRDATNQRGLSLERLTYHLSRRGHELSAATLSYWRTGRSRAPSAWVRMDQPTWAASKADNSCSLASKAGRNACQLA